MRRPRSELKRFAAEHSTLSSLQSAKKSMDGEMPHVEKSDGKRQERTKKKFLSELEE